jgi:cob(I)alamin adenosyltransferase
VKIYTGTGDRGKTSLFSGERVAKNNDHIETYGDIDELNSVIGALLASLRDIDDQLVDELKQIQSNLFAVSAWLATSPGSAVTQTLQPLSDDPAKRLERAVDRIDAGLPPLKQFILPGGHPTAAWAHIARTVCRRAERRLVALTASQTHGADDGNYQHALVFLNRLSDYFFVLARHLNKVQRVEDITWQPE